MPTFRMPLSGNVAQTINPWTFLFNPIGGQVGLVNIELGQSSNPIVEQEVLTDVASYGKQIGRIEDAVMLCLKRLEPEGGWTGEDKKTVEALRELVRGVQAVKDRHPRSDAALAESAAAPTSAA